MSCRFLACLSIVAIFTAPAATAADGSASAAATSASAPRTAWGAPDLRGIWDFRTITPLERPDELAGKEVLADREAAFFPDPGWP